MIPNVIFRRSKLYDAFLKRADDFTMPEDIEFDKKIKELEDKWLQGGDKILTEIAATAKMPWYRKEIVCYITAGIIPYSDPLTLNLRSSIDTLTHELIHCILSEPQNRELWNKIWAYIDSHYKEEPAITKTHIVVHAIHASILKKLFGEERFKSEKESMHNPQYMKAWEVVEKEGYEHLLAELTKGF